MGLVEPVFLLPLHLFLELAGELDVVIEGELADLFGLVEAVAVRMAVGLSVVIDGCWLGGPVLACFALLAHAYFQELPDEVLLLVLVEEGEQQVDFEEVGVLVLGCGRSTYWRIAL